MAALIGAILALSGIGMYMYRSRQATIAMNKNQERQFGMRKRGLTSLSYYKEPSHEITDPHQYTNEMMSTSVKNRVNARYGVPLTQYAPPGNAKVMVGHSKHGNDMWREAM